MDSLSRELWKKILPAEEPVTPVRAQDSRRDPVDHWPMAVLLERAAYLRKLAKFGDGSASDTIKDYPDHCAMLLVLRRSGAAELQERFAHLFIVLEGRATLLTGGTVPGARTIAPGEIHGESIEDGEPQPLRAGDVVHVPAGLAHQILVAGESSISCLVVKIEQHV